MNPSERQDAELLADFCRTQDEDAFRELVTRHRPLVLGTARRILACQADAEDAAQAVFLALALKHPRVEAQRGLAPWLHTVTVRVALDLKKSNIRRHLRHEAVEALPGVAMPESGGLLDEELQKLPGTLRRTLVLHYLEGLSLEEIARREGCSVSAVSMRLTRGREKLKARLGAAGLSAALAGLAGSPSAVSAAWASAVAGMAARLTAGVRLTEPAVVPLLALAHHALRLTWRELWRPLCGGVGAAAAAVSIFSVLSAAVASSAEPVRGWKEPLPVPAPAPVVEVEMPSEHPLILAVKKSYSWTSMGPFVQVLDQHADAINAAKDAQGRSVLSLAILKRYNEFAALLVLRGADVNATDAAGRTPLMEAVKTGQTWTQLLLILRGAQVDVVAADGTTALSQAVKAGDVRHAEILLWAGARLDLPPPAVPVTPLAEGNAEMQALLQDYLKPEAAVFGGDHGPPAFVRHPLHEAARRGDFPLLQKLASLGANSRDDKGRTPLHEAISAGQPEVVFYLLMIGADPNALDDQGRSPLNTTMGWLGGGLDANRVFLLAKGANPNSLRKDGHTELTWAVVRDNEHGVQWLLWMGVDPRQSSKHGTAFEIAVREGNQRIIDLLRRNGVDGPIRLSDDPGWILSNAARRGDLAAIDEALAAGAEIDAPDEAGNSPLLQALAKRNVEAAWHLLERGADPEFVNAKTGANPLLTTIGWDFHEMTLFREALLEAGVDPNVKSKDGSTVLMRSVWHTPTMPLKQLLKYGADPNIRDAKGRTALTRAIQEGKLETAEFLRAHGAKE